MSATVYLGTSEFAAHVLQRLIESSHRPELVVTRPPRPRGRGRKVAQPPVVAVAEAAGIEIFQPDDVNEPQSFERIVAANPAAVCLCAYGAIIREPLLSNWEILNVHPSLLPRWRGAAPIERAIAAGDEVTGTSIMRLVAEMDAGPVCAQATTAIGRDDTYGTVAERLAVLAGGQLLTALDALAAAQPLKWRDQSELSDQDPTYAEKITRDDRRLRPTSETAVRLDQMVRALTPHIGAFVELEGGGVLTVEAARPLVGGPDPGIVEVVDSALVIGTIRGGLEVARLRPPGRNSMDSESYLRGNPVPRLATQ